MYLKSIFASSLLVILLAPGAAIGKVDQPPPDLFDDYGIQQAAKKVLPKKAIKGRNRRVNVHSDMLWADSLTLNLFDDVVVTAIRDRLIDRVKKNITWIGHVAGEQDSEVFLTVRDKTMSGTVRIGKDLYEIEYRGSNKHDITKVDPDINPRLSDSKTVADFIAAGGEADTTPIPTPAGVAANAATTGTIIDVMVVYTGQAKTNAYGQTGIETKIANAVAQANQSYINSQIDMQLNVVYMGEINYTETGNMVTSVTQLAGAADGKMDEIHALRNQYGADQVVLITADTNYCGIAYVMTNASSSFAPYAFSVVHDDSRYACLADHSLAHELGHNQGSQHNRENANTLGAFDYSYGYRLCQTGGFRTIMSYSCNGPRLSYFSNPDVTLPNGLVTGTATEDNARSINNTKAIVAAFRAPVTATAPNTPANLVASTLSFSEINLIWSDTSDNETGFRLERSDDGGLTWNEFAVAAGNTASFIDSGRAPSTIYQYRVRAYNSKGNSEYSNISSATTGVDPTCAVNTPALAMSSPSKGYSKGGSELTYTIDLTNQDSSTCGISTFTLTTSDGTTLGSYALRPGDTASATWTTTAPATDGSYTKFVTAIASGHASASNSATVIVDATAPTAPGNLTAMIKRGLQVAVSWSASADTGSGLKYYVIRRNNSIIAITTNTSYIDIPSIVSYDYVYTVEAHDNVGNFNSSSTLMTIGIR